MSFYRQIRISYGRITINYGLVTVGYGRITVNYDGPWAALWALVWPPLGIGEPWRDLSLELWRGPSLRPAGALPWALEALGPYKYITNCVFNVRRSSPGIRFSRSRELTDAKMTSFEIVLLFCVIKLCCPCTT